MIRYRSSQLLAIVALCAPLGTIGALVGNACAAPGDIVDLEGDTHHNPPASTTDKSTPTTSAPATEKATQNGVKETIDSAKEKSAIEKLKLRAGERVGDDPRGKAQVLGMSLQEGAHERVKVVEVAMNSPAFDAGIMKGDEILAFQGFRGESYRKWIDGIRRLTTDTGAGLKIPVVVARDGKQLTVRIEVQEKPVRPSNPRVLAQPGSPVIPPGVGPALPASAGPDGPAVVNGGNNVVIDNNGPFGEFFGGQAASANERAVAQIMRIGGQTSPNPTAGVPQNSSVGATAAPNNAGAKIGMAGFRDDPAGMVVMVDVGALPPGNYTVGIGDPSVIGGANVTGTGTANPSLPAPQVPAPQRGGPAVPNGAAPARAGAGEPQGNLPPASSASIPRTVLAQVGAQGQSESVANGTATEVDNIPPTGQVRPSSIPATGEVNPSSSTPTGQSSVNNAQRAQAATSGQNNPGAGAGNGTLGQIGTITVGQNGTGRMQQKVESAQVRNVVGQAIVIYSQGGAQQTLPSNLNDGVNTSAGQGVTDSPAARGSQPSSGTNGRQTPAAAQTAPGSQVPIAAGIIQLVTDRRPPATNGAVEQPASAGPPAGQNLVR